MVFHKKCLLLIKKVLHTKLENRLHLCENLLDASCHIEGTDCALRSK